MDATDTFLCHLEKKKVSEEFCLIELLFVMGKKEDREGETECMSKGFCSTVAGTLDFLVEH